MIKGWIPLFGSSSMPTAGDAGTGAGSLAALLISKGALILERPPWDTIQPLVQDAGTGDENSVLGVSEQFCTAKE